MSDHDFSAFAGTLIRYGANTWAWSDHTPAPQVKDLTLSEHYNFRCRTNGRGGALVEVPVKLAASEDDLAWCAKRGYDKALSGDDTGMRRLHPDGRITRQSEREGGAAIREVWLVPAEDWDARPPVGVVWAQDDEPAILAKARELGWSAEVGWPWSRRGGAVRVFSLLFYSQGGILSHRSDRTDYEYENHFARRDLDAILEEELLNYTIILKRMWRDVNKMKPSVILTFTIWVSLLAFSCNDRVGDANLGSEQIPKPMKRVVNVLQSEGWANTPRAVALVEEFAKKIGLEVTIERTVIRTEEDVQKHEFIGSPTVRIKGLDVEPSARDATQFGFT